ncbi:CBS domain-containing protein, partial [bacterium AH-315-F18]|nr:CBS domain-containing protein [bacterium AH-315-F18]
MSKVKDLLAGKKSNEVAAVERQHTVLQAAKDMEAQGIGAVVVKDGPQVVGIFTERDVLNRVVAKGLDAAGTKVEDVMTSPVAVCTSDTDIEECRSLMISKNMRHLPVVDDGHLVGIISVRDLIEAEVGKHEQTIRYLNE